MTSVSPRSLQLLHDIITDDDEKSADLYTEQTESSEADNNCRGENMNGDVDANLNNTLNFFEKLEKENGSVGINGHVKVNGFMNGHVENGIQEDTLQGIAEESEDDSYTVTEEVSETTADTSTLDTSTSIRVSKKNSHNRRSNKHRRDYNHNIPKPSKTSSVRDNSTDRDSMSDIKETMSDSGRVGRRQRKLKRAQYQEFRPIGLEPLETAEERLEQKYKELEGLMSGQFVEQKKALTMNHLQQMELLRQQYAIASHGLPPSGVLIPRSLPSHHRSNGYHRQAGRDKENHGHPASEDEAYTTIRTLQASRGSQRRSRARSARTRPLSATRHNQSRSTSRDRRDRSDNTVEHGERSKARSRSTSGSRSSSPRSPRRPATETRLKNTENEFVRDWIKKKDREYRQHKAEERRKKRQERKDKIEKQLEREEKYKNSDQIVQAWMKQKQREAYRKQRQEHRELRQEVKEKEQERSHSVSGIHGWGVDRPLSAPSPVRTDRNKIRVQRPGTTASEVRENEEKKAKQSDNEDAIPQPPMTKYVYRRPVLGKVRLRNKQPQHEEPKPPPVRKSVEKPLSKEEIEKKQRVSYDDWLQQKRKEDQEKKKEMQRKKEQAQSNPEYEFPVPELVQNSENNVLRGKGIPGSSGRSSARPGYVSKIISQEERERIREMARGKKRLNRSVEEEVDSSYDERSESPEEAIQRVAKNVVSFVLKSLSDDDVEDGLFEDTDEAEHEGLSNFSLLGSRKTLSSRPMSASAARIPGPQVSKSPRRPASAQPKQKESSRTSFEGCIPFPDDIGAPPTVLRVQEKLFAERMSDSEEGQQATPREESSSKFGRFTVEEEDVVQEDDTNFEAQEEEVAEEDQTKEEDGIRESQKKKVSFCEETTIFDDVDPDEYEELEAWDDEAGEADFDVEKVKKMFIEGSQDQTEAQEQEETNQEQSNTEQEQNQEQGVTEEQTQEQGDKDEQTQDQGDTEGQIEEQGNIEEQTQQGEVEEQNKEEVNLEEQTQEDNSGKDEDMKGEEEEIAEDLPQDENMEAEQGKTDQEQDGDGVFLTSSPEF